MKKLVAGGVAVTAAVAGLVVGVVSLIPDKAPPPEPIPNIYALINLAHLPGCTNPEHPAGQPSDCLTFRADLERAVDAAIALKGDREVARYVQAMRRAILKDAAAVVRNRLAEQRARNPKAAEPPGLREAIHDMDRRAGE